MTDQEINEAVARKLGYIKDPLSIGWFKPEDGVRIIPSFCERIEAAFEIVEKFQGYFDLSYRINDDPGPWYCRLKDFEAHAPTAPMAIAIAFLKLMEANNG